MGDCTFCAIAEGETHAHVLVETERTVAFLDSNPAVQGHTLVIPKAHHEDLFQAEDSLVAAVFQTATRVSEALEETVDHDGVSLFYSPGPLVGRITHAHVHLMPRYTDDNISVSLPRESLSESDARRLVTEIEPHL
jgi:histidine triad (HIT) family protein